MPETQATPTTTAPKTRRVWTAKKKAGVLAYYREHGHTATTKHYRINSSMLRRWRSENGGSGAHAPRRARKWTPSRIARVLAFAGDHTTRETLERFRISSAQLFYWKQSGGKRSGPTKQIDITRMKPGPKRMTGQIEAVIHLERWRTARLAFIREGGDPQEYDLDAELALRALKGKG